MKAVFALILSAFLFVGCKKDSKPNIPEEPKITSVNTTCTVQGGGKAINFQINITTGITLKKVELYKSPSTKISEITTPQTGMYTMYHVVPSCPVTADNAMYYFVFTKSDDTQVTTTPFKVAF